MQKEKKMLLNGNVGKRAMVKQRVIEMTKTLNGERTGAKLCKDSLVKRRTEAESGQMDR